MSGISIGTDPEIFVFDGKELIPAFEFLPSKKEAKLCFWDGFQAEFTTRPDMRTSALLDSVRLGLLAISLRAKKHTPNARLSVLNTVKIARHHLAHAKPEHVILGCDPSKNLYAMHGQETGGGRELEYRFSGGHLHFGLPSTEISFALERRIVEMLDKVLGVAGTALAGGLDTPVRRKYYGLAGEYRRPKHGIEYRVLSNFWLTHPAIAALVLDLGQATVRMVLNSLEAMWQVPGMEAARIINQVDVEGARKVIEGNLKALRVMLGEHYGDYVAGHNAIRTILGGIGSAVEQPFEVEHNWRIGTEEPWEGDYSWLTASRKLSQRQLI